MASWALSPVQSPAISGLGCLYACLGSGRKYSEAMPMAQCSPSAPGQTEETGLGRQESIQRDVPRLYSALLVRFGCNLDKKSFCATRSVTELYC